MAKFVLIDDDPLFGNIMTRFAKARGVEVDYFESMLDFHAFGCASCYDAAIVDYDLGHMTGIDIAEQLDLIFGDIPMVLVSSQKRIPALGQSWPDPIKCFVAKQDGVEAIFSAATAALSGYLPRRDQQVEHGVADEQIGI